MRQLFPLCILLLLGCLNHAKAQKYTFAKPIPYRLQATENVPLYRSLNDTTSSTRKVAKNTEVWVTGRHSSRWAIITFMDFTYYVSTRYLPTLVADTKGGQLADLPGLPVDETTKRIVSSEVVAVPNATKDELYIRGKVWFANYFKSAQNVIQADDKEAGVLVGKGWEEMDFQSLGRIVPLKLWYTVTLTFKEGRYKQEIKNFMIQWPSSQQIPNPPVREAEDVVFERNKKGDVTNWAKQNSAALAKSIHSTQESIKVSMAKPAAGTDW